MNFKLLSLFHRLFIHHITVARLVAAVISCKLILMLAFLISLHVPWLWTVAVSVDYSTETWLWSNVLTVCHVIYCYLSELHLQKRQRLFSFYCPVWSSVIKHWKFLAVDWKLIVLLILLDLRVTGRTQTCLWAFSIWVAGWCCFVLPYKVLFSLCINKNWSLFDNGPNTGT